MTTELAREIAEIGVRLADDAYVAWCAAEGESGRALQAWSEGGAGDRSRAYLAYRAALDREEAAARDLQRLSHLTRACRDGLRAGAESSSALD